MILILYTTLYRKGGPKFVRAARTLAEQIQKANPEIPVKHLAIESKKAFCGAIGDVANDDREIFELHFIGHSGLYGPMFGTTEWPEQLSPHEWRQLKIPFAEEGVAYFHACRTSRWFTPFFASTFGVRTWGYHWYTCFSAAPDRFVWERKSWSDNDPLWVVSIGGRKSHGLLGSLSKYSGRRPLEPMIAVDPEQIGSEAGYDHVAELYDATFADIRVREDEWNWILNHLPKQNDLRVVDIGCGNGSLLAALSGRIKTGYGFDASTKMIRHAKERFGEDSNLNFDVIEGPSIPLPDNSVDLIVSFMSFRYLDWDPIIDEVARLLNPEGRLLIVDMAASPVKLRDILRLVASKLRHRKQSAKSPAFRSNLKKLVCDPAWQQMVGHNPVRAEHEYRWYLSSRFPQGNIQTLNVSSTHKLLAFDSGPIKKMRKKRISYP